MNILQGHSSARTIFFLCFLLLPALAQSQTTTPDKQNDPAQGQQSQPSGGSGTAATQTGAASQSNPQATPAAPAPNATPAEPNTDDSNGKQTKRMLYVIPNFTAVSAGAQLPPLTARQKFVMATEDSVDYSAFTWAGILAGQSMILKEDPELRGGIAGYGRYYWRAFLDQASGSYFSEAIVPALTHEDPRYFTRGHGGFLRRSGYALSQVVLTKTDSGGDKLSNFSEIVGDGLSAGLSNAYHPPQERGFTKTAENWGTGIESAALNNLLKEFWPISASSFFDKNEIALDYIPVDKYFCLSP